MDYNYTLKNEDIYYGFVKGNNKIVFVKPGLGGNYSGYENKYLRIARQLNEKYGCSVIVASNPEEKRNHFNSDKQILEQYISENNITSPEFFFFGNSNGGVKGLELANNGVAFRKMVLVNMPLMLNFHKTKRYVSAIPQTDIVAIYGQHDQSVPYLPFFEGKFENVKVLTVPNADHNFKGLLNEFIDLSDYLMK